MSYLHNDFLTDDEDYNNNLVEYAHKIQLLCNKFSKPYSAILKEFAGDNYFNVLSALFTVSTLSLKSVLESLVELNKNEKFKKHISGLFAELTNDIETYLQVSMTKIRLEAINFAEEHASSNNGANSNSANEVKH